MSFKLNEHNSKLIDSTIFRLKKKNKTYQEIADSINSMGLKTSRGKDFDSKAVSNRLTRFAIRQKRLEKKHSHKRVRVVDVGLAPEPVRRNRLVAFVGSAAEVLEAIRGMT